MAEEAAPPANPEVEKTAAAAQLHVAVERADDGQSVSIYIKAPKLAEVVRKMAPGNYALKEYAEPYRPILVPLEADKTRAITRPAITTITKNLVRGADWSWDAPRACLLYNPDALEAGFTVKVKLDQPITEDITRNWAMMLVNGCKDIMKNAKPFRMSWILMEEG